MTTVRSLLNALNIHTGDVDTDIRTALTELVQLRKKVRVAESKRVLHIQNWDEETMHITLDGKDFARANHDEHGWAGMNLVKVTALRTAEENGWIVRETWGDPDDPSDEELDATRSEDEDATT